jgi:hypothetical protein
MHQTAPIPYQPLQPDRDAEHLRLLALFHYIYGGIVAALSCFFIIHILMGAWALKNPAMFNPPAAATTQPGAPTPGPPPAFFGYMFVCMGTGALLLGWTVGGLTVYAGRCISRRKNWVFVLVMAGINCLSAPFGTLLGVFTFVVLLRDSVKPLFGRAPSIPPAAAYAPPGPYPPPPGAYPPAGPYNPP